MLLKTLQIRNIGRFDFSTAVELAQATVVYAENGRGKTTLAAILRSLQTGEPLHILERKTIGSADQPVVGFLATVNAKNNQCKFDGQVWSTTLGDCEIFDSAFIAQNVYSGSEIDPDHRRSLHKFVLGASNVALARKVDELDDQIRATTQSIAEAELAVQKCCLDGMKLEHFVGLPASPTIEQEIVAQETVVEAARAAATIAAARSFARAPMPRFDPVTWDSVLGTSLADVEAQAENRVRVHLETHLSEGAEAWIADGVAYLGQETCPFCAADTSGNDLVRAYRSLFSRAYEDLKTEVTTLARAASTALSEAAFDLVRRAIQTNAAVAPTWAAYSTECPPAPDLEMAEKMRGVLERAYAAAFVEKSGGILEPVAVTSQSAAAWSEIAALQKQLDEYNSAIE